MSPSDRLSLLVLNAIDAVGVVVIVLVALTFLFLAWGYVMGSIILACEWLGRQSRAWRTLYEGMLIIALCAVAYLCCWVHVGTVYTPARSNYPIA